MMKETRWHYYMSSGRWYRVKARYGIDYEFARRHNQTAEFSVTGDVEYKARNNRWYGHSSGQVTEEIEAHIPEIAPYLKWHLFDPEVHSHYFENARYWFEMAQGIQPMGRFDKDPIGAFKRTIRLGAFPGDVVPQEVEFDLLVAEKVMAPRWRGPKEWRPGQGAPRLSWGFVRAWLEERLPKLLAAWVVDMGELGVLEE